MRANKRRYVRQMPKIYGNLQPPERRLISFPLWKIVRKTTPYLIGIGLLYIVFAGTLFRVRNIEVKGASLTEPSTIQALVPTGGSIWSFPKSQVSETIMQNPAVLNVQILRGFPSSILVDITERSAAAFWITGTKGSVLDNQGLAFLAYDINALPASDSVVGKTLENLPHIVDTSGLGADLNQQVASELFLTFVGNVQSQMQTLLPTYVIDHFEVAGTTYDVTMVTKSGLRVQLGSLGDASVQIRNLTRLERDGKLIGVTSVDLRVDRWAYVK